MKKKPLVISVYGRAYTLHGIPYTTILMPDDKLQGIVFPTEIVMKHVKEQTLFQIGNVKYLIADGEYGLELKSEVFLRPEPKMPCNKMLSHARRTLKEMELSVQHMTEGGQPRSESAMKRDAIILAMVDWFGLKTTTALGFSVYRINVATHRDREYKRNKSEFYLDILSEVRQHEVKDYQNSTV